MNIGNIIREVVGTDKLEALKQIFSATETKEIFVDAKLADGTIVRVADDSFKVGAKVDVVAEDGTLSAAPNGEHTLEDGTVIVVADGLITEMSSAAEESTDTEVDMAQNIEADTKAVTEKEGYTMDSCIADMTAKYGDEETAKKVCSALGENKSDSGMFAVQLKSDIIDLQIELHKSKQVSENFNSAQQKEIETLREQNKLMFEIINKLADMPADEPTQKPQSAINKEGFSLKAFAAEMKEIKQNSKNKTRN